MAASEVDLVNAALIELGQGRITALTDRSKTAVASAAIYETTRDKVLRANGWRCAQTRAVLSLSAETPAFQWSRAYILPPDFIRVVEFNGIRGEASQIETWVVEGREILTDDDGANLVYVWRLKDVARMDESLKDAIVARLCADLCLQLTADQKKKRDFEGLYADRIAEANVQSRSEGAMEAVQAGSWLTARMSHTIEDRPIDLNP